jgi:hypothetical protein
MLKPFPLRNTQKYFDVLSIACYHSSHTPLIKQVIQKLPKSQYKYWEVEKTYISSLFQGNTMGN